MEDYVWWVSGVKATLVVCNLWRKYDWKEPNRLLVVQTGEGVNHAKVFKAHAVPRVEFSGDGDGLIQKKGTQRCLSEKAPTN